MTVKKRPARKQQPSVWVVEWRPGKVWQPIATAVDRRSALEQQRALHWNCPDDTFRVAEYRRVRGR